MIRKTIVFSVYISLITGLVGAVDVKIPGADNRISANAYESYIHHDSLIRNIQEEALRDFQKSKQYDKTKQLYRDNGLSEKEAETVIRESYVGPLNLYEGQPAPRTRPTGCEDRRREQSRSRRRHARRNHAA